MAPKREAKGTPGEAGSASVTVPLTKQLLTAAEVAAMLSAVKGSPTSVRQVRHMHSRGQLPPASSIPGIGVRWTVAAIRGFLDSLVAPAVTDV